MFFSLFYIFWYSRFSFRNLKDANSFMSLWCSATSSLTICSWCDITYSQFVSINIQGRDSSLQRYYYYIIIVSFILIRKRFFLNYFYRNRLFRPLTKEDLQGGWGGGAEVFLCLTGEGAGNARTIFARKLYLSVCHDIWFTRTASTSY